MEGRTTEEIRADLPGWDLWRDGVVGGEPLAQVSLRADRVIELVRASQETCSCSHMRTSCG